MPDCSCSYSGCALLAALRWGCAMVVLRLGYINAPPVPAPARAAAGFTEHSEVAGLCDRGHAWRAFWPTNGHAPRRASREKMRGCQRARRSGGIRPATGVTFPEDKHLESSTWGSLEAVKGPDSRHRCAWPYRFPGYRPPAGAVAGLRSGVSHPPPARRRGSGVQVGNELAFQPDDQVLEPELLLL